MESLRLNYLQYNHWVHEKMCNYLSEIDETEIVANKKADYQTIKKVILHIADAEQTWLARLNGKHIPHMHNHSTFHRGQVMCMLRHVGYTDHSASDFIMFLREG